MLLGLAKKVKSTRVYTCSVRIDQYTKVSLYFITPTDKQNTSSPSSSSSDGQSGTLSLARVEMHVDNRTKDRKNPHDFYTSIKRFRSEHTEDNYRFNKQRPRFMADVPAMGLFSEQSGRFKDRSISQCESREEMTQLIDLLHSVEEADPSRSPKTMGASRGRSPIPKVILDSAEELLAHSLNREKCLHLQTAVKKLEPENDKRIIDLLLQGVVLNIKEIACNTYGNFLLQMLIPKFDARQRVAFLHKIGDSIGELCKDPRGIFCLQALIEQLSSDEEMNAFFSLFGRDLLELTKDANAGFVFKQMIQHFPAYYSMQLLKLIRPDFYEVAGDKYGICVVKFIISKVDREKELFRTVVRDFLAHVKRGRHNSHFNFGLQHLIEVSNETRWVLPELETLLCRFFEGKGKAKIRSKSIGQTIQLALCYHRQDFVEANICPHLERFLQQPRSANENSLLLFVQTLWPGRCLSY